MLQPPRKVRTLRSSYLDPLNVSLVRTAVGSRAFSVAAHRLWNEPPLEIRSAKTQISFRKYLKTYFLVRLFRLESSVVRLAQTKNANGFGTMSRITIMFVAPLRSDHRFRRYRIIIFLVMKWYVSCCMRAAYHRVPIVNFKKQTILINNFGAVNNE